MAKTKNKNALNTDEDKNLNPVKIEQKHHLGTFSNVFSDKLFYEHAALFLDRDGVIIDEINYLHKVADITFIPGVAEAVARANGLNVPVILITNQAGIGRGFYGWNDFHNVQKHIQTHFANHSAHIDMVLACAYHGDGIKEYKVSDHHWRKPNPGMLLEAARVLRIDLKKSFIVGDSLSDLAAGIAAGLEAGALVETGHGEREWNEKDGKKMFKNWQKKYKFLPVKISNAALAINRWLSQLDSNILS